MKNLSIEFCKSVKSARREAGLTQGELAAEVGCKQSALSMFEQGDGTKLNDEVIGKIAKKFNLTVSETPSNDSASPFPHLRQGFGGQAVPRSPFPVPHSLGFCPNPNCPTNHEYFVEEVRLFLPDREAADPMGGRYCAMCGELLERKCPNCGAPVHKGAICAFCGQPYVVKR